MTCGKVFKLRSWAKDAGERRVVVPDLENEGLQLVLEPLALVADERGVADARLDPQEGDVRRVEAPLGQVLHGLD